MERERERERKQVERGDRRGAGAPTRRANSIKRQSSRLNCDHGTRVGLIEHINLSVASSTAHEKCVRTICIQFGDRQTDSAGNAVS